MIPYGRQDITASDIEEVVEVLKSDFLTQGTVVPRFETAVSEKVGADYAIAVNSATSALHIACIALGLGNDDILWTVPNTFVASANCALYCGAKVDFVDINHLTYNIDVDELENKLVIASQENKLPKIVIPVHFSGQSCDMSRIYELSKLYGFKIIEDASHAIGGKYCNEYIGSCRYCDITVFSFHPVKIITAGEGGMALTNDPVLASKMNMLRSHGVTRDIDKLTLESPGPWYYEQQMLGFNYRITDIQASLGLSQLNRLDDYILRRNELAEIYNEYLSDLPIQLPITLKGNISAFHLYVIRLKNEALCKKHKDIFVELREQGIGVNLHYIPVHMQPYYQELGFYEGQYTEAESYSKEAITLPLYPNLTNEEQMYVINVLHQVLDVYIL